MEEQQESNLLFHGPCDNCGSSDANAVYDDGHKYCFSCLHYTHPEGTERPALVETKATGLIAPGQASALGKRRLREDTCKKFGYTLGTYNGDTVQIANYRRDGKIVAQKIRTKDKQFKFLGDTKNAGLYGQHLWKDGGKRLVITEGELDALSYSQASDNKWPTVSVPNGAAGAVKAIRREYEFVSKFSDVVLMFDMDEAGQSAALEVAKMLKPGQARIAHLPEKDPSDLLQNGRGGDLVQAMWDAKPYRPDGIVAAADLWDRVKRPKENNCIEYPWEGLNNKTLGARKGELVVFTAGSGVGKSAVVREIAYDFLQKDQKVGMIMLEENIERTTLGMMGLHLNYPLHLDRGEFTEEQLKEAFNATSSKLWLYDHFGSTSASNLLERIRYLASGCECDFIILDHISIAVSDPSVHDDGLDERKLIDKLMTQLRSLVEELGVGLFVISHLRRPSGDRGHEEGALTSLSQLRGSHAIAQLSDFVIGLERNQQDEEHRNETTVRVLKNRFSGSTGEACLLHYSEQTGRLSEGFSTDDFTKHEGDDY